MARIQLFNYHVEGFGGNLHKVPFCNDTEDLQKLLDKVKEHQQRFYMYQIPTIQWEQLINRQMFKY